MAKTERDERNELEGAVASLERQGDDLRETNDTLTAENDSLRGENEDLAAQVADLEDEESTTATTVSSSGLPGEAEGTPAARSYRQVYPAQDLVLNQSCSHQNAADLDVPSIGSRPDWWDVEYYTNCGNAIGKLQFANYTRHAPGPADATAAQCADVLRRSGVASDDHVVPLPGAVICVQTVTDLSEDIPPRVVRMVVTAVDDGESVTVNVEAWEPD